MQIKTKLSLVLCIPLLALMFLGINDVLDSRNLAHKAGVVKGATELAVVIGNYVHESQKERGATAIFLSSEGLQFKNELLAHRQQTDIRRQDLNELIANMDRSVLPPNFLQALDSAAFQLDRLDQVRSQVSRLDMTIDEALGFYTGIHSYFLGAVGEMIDTSPSTEQANAIMAYTSFLKGKERAGIERALLSAVFTADQFAPGRYGWFIALETEQKLFLDQFQFLATQELDNAYREANASADFAEVLRYRQIAKDKHLIGGFEVDPSVWFNTITRKINSLKQLEDKIAQDLIDQATLAEGTATTQAMLILAGIVTLLVGIVLVGLFLFRQVFGDIKTLTRHLREIAQGEGDLTRRLTIRNQDELGDLARWFNTFLDKLHPIIEELVGHVGSVKSSANQGSNLAVQTNDKIQSHYEEVEQVVTAINELAATAQDVANNTVKAADATRNASVASDQGKDVVEKSTAAIAALTGKIESATAVVQQLESDSKDVGAIIDVINGIAEQTNLLALNAAIEAARAGEQGRGFAVVADEVRSLAQRTQESIGQIEEMVSRLQSGADQAVKAMADSREIAVQTASQSNGALDALLQITTATSLINDLNIQVASASEQQSAVTEEINRNVTKIQTVTHEISVNAATSVSESEALDVTAEQLHRLAIQFSV